METTKKLNVRITEKHDLEAAWVAVDPPFVPNKGELIVYDTEVDADGNILELPAGRTTPYTYERLKIGDGVHNVNELPFVSDKLPGNATGSRTHKVIIATPMNEDGTFDEQFRYPADYGKDSDDPDVKALAGKPFDKKHYAKRVINGDGDKGIIMHSNRDKKLAEGLINEIDYGNYADHDEPYLFYDSDPEKYRYTIPGRDTYGCMTSEPGIKEFHNTTVSQLLKTNNPHKKIDYFRLDSTGYGVFSNPYSNTVVYRDDSVTDCPIYPLPIIHWYPTQTITSSFYCINFNIPTEFSSNRFSIGLWLYNNDFRAKKLEDGSIEYHTFRIKMGANGDSGNISLLKLYNTTKLGDNCNITVDANIGKWYHITINCNISSEKKNITLLQFGSQVMTAPSDISMQDGYDYSTGLHYSMPVMVEGELDWFVRYPNAYYNPLKVGAPVESTDAANKEYVDLLRSDVNSIESETKEAIEENKIALDTYITESSYPSIDYFELDEFGFAKTYDQSNPAYTSFLKQESGVNCPVYPNPIGKFTALRDFVSTLTYTKFIVPTTLIEKEFNVGFWLYNNLSNESGKQQYFRMWLLNNAGATVSLFNGFYDLSVGKTQTVSGNTYLVDKQIGDWFHITVKITSKNIAIVGLGSNYMKTGNSLYLSMPVMVQDEIEWYKKYRNEYYVAPFKVGIATKESQAVNLKQAKSIIDSSKIVYFESSETSKKSLIDVPVSNHKLTKYISSTDSNILEEYWMSVLVGEFKEYTFKEPVLASIYLFEKTYYYLNPNTHEYEETREASYTFNWTETGKQVKLTIIDNGQFTTEVKEFVDANSFYELRNEIEELTEDTLILLCGDSKTNID